MTDEPTPKQFSNRKLLLLIILVSVATAITVIALNYETISNTATTTSVLTNFPIQLFDEGYDIICINHKTSCLIQMSDHMAYTRDYYNGKDLHSFRAINDTTIQMLDNLDGYEKVFTSYHFYVDQFKMTETLKQNSTITYWLVEKR